MADTPPIDEAAIRTIAALLHETDLSEIEIVHGETKLRVARHVSPTPVTVAPPPVASAAPATAAPTGPAKAPEGAVLSPMVGTAYRAPEPGSRPFVDVGETVRVGQVVMIVEAMKTMNQIIAERAGTVTDIFVEDGQPVEYGEPLLAIA
ncbi:acetyl-CoA carboxylase biotin carboxyl carrier protein [Acuticoccus sediminis]|uniref:Biotin carboxyl carrier protein of acetyl-CoA carboxylase n=1 Tax=Acuticoccus sediminis TaxID=2184697 RepID=A0A8B2NG85_9HYPH|nr:acetyl-CoA carboxylase biotin carboxyl carrier protein [Acuticoccus sediminis]RAH98260.1 acetyl-CoA carboxylase biotin carboxyl carrier protein [Acuticoccus sediminis]